MKVRKEILSFDYGGNVTLKKKITIEKMVI